MKNSQKIKIGISMILSVVLMITMVMMSPINVNAASTLLSVPYINQNGYPVGCWAACGAMVTSYKKGTSVTLAGFASAASASPSSIGGQPQIQKGEKNLCNNYYQQYSQTYLTYSQVQYYINCVTPIVCRVDRDTIADSGNEHFVVIRGWDYNGNSEYMYVHDPNSSVGPNRYILHPIFTTYGSTYYGYYWIASLYNWAQSY